MLRRCLPPHRYDTEVSIFIYIISNLTSKSPIRISQLHFIIEVYQKLSSTYSEWITDNTPAYIYYNLNTYLSKDSGEQTLKLLFYVDY